MKIKTLSQFDLFPFLVLFGISSCQYDPHANLLTTTEPRKEDITGTYILDRYDLSDKCPIPKPEIQVEIRSDGTFTAINIPPWKSDGPDDDCFSTFQSGEGRWEKSVMGRLDPGSRKVWGVYLRTKKSQFHPADFTGDKPPYGIIFTLGDPDSGNAILLKKKEQYTKG